MKWLRRAIERRWTSKDSNDAVALMDSAKRELDLAKEALDGELTLSNEQKLAQKAQEMAEQLTEDADAPR